jgi:SAM-dependent methyltransferase
VSSFESLVSDALAAPVSGWDFSWLRDRTAIDPLPWDYRDLVSVRAAKARCMLDMGTGGGEVLSGLVARSPLTVATEAWPPNVPVAAARLRRLGIPVVHVEGAPDNMVQNDPPQRLPFLECSFDLVTNRHEAFVAADVARVLANGGRFVTQQVDARAYDDFYSALGRARPVQPSSWLPLATLQLEEAGLRVRTAMAGQEVQRFDDVGAVVFYLRAVPWAIDNFDVAADRESLVRLHQQLQEKPLRVRQQRFLVEAEKP